MGDGNRGESSPVNEPRDRPHAGREHWDVDRPEDDAQLDTLWIRWTDGKSDLHLHRVCEVIPQVRRTDSFPYVEIAPEAGELPLFEPVADDERDGEPSPTQFQFVSGLPRQLLRHVPLLIFVSAIVMFLGAELDPTVNGLSALVPEVGGTNLLLLGIFTALTPFLLWLLSVVGVLDFDDAFQGAVIYGLVGALAAGVGVTALLATVAEHPSEIDANVILASGYLLALLVGGMLLYEGILRIEHLFVKLQYRTDDIIENPDAYRRFLTHLDRALTGKTLFGIHPSRLFGLLFAGQFLILWMLGSGPQNMNYTVGIAVNFALNAVLVTIVFQFFVLVRYFNLLLNESTRYCDVGLTYQPFHIDGRGGFLDFGRFATRINVILSLGGAYLVYRLYIVGGRTFPVEGVTGFTDPVLATVWALNFVGPVVAYALGASAWGYYSFWSIHKKMARDKQVLARKYQGHRDVKDGDRTPSAGDDIGEFADSDGPDWDTFRSAPTWPTDVNKMLSLLSGNALPLLFPVVNLFI